MHKFFRDSTKSKVNGKSKDELESPNHEKVAALNATITESLTSQNAQVLEICSKYRLFIFSFNL